ncbi:hypothetical protein AHAS_Ahas13G0386600 [Arachis hypogaea]
MTITLQNMAYQLGLNIEGDSVGLDPFNDRVETRLRQWRRILNGIGIYNTPYSDPLIQDIVPQRTIEAKASTVVVCSLFCFSIVKRHQIDRMVRQFGGLQRILTRALNIDEMHGHDGRFSRGYIPEDLSIHCSKAPQLNQPEDGELPPVRPHGGRRGRACPRCGVAACRWDRASVSPPRDRHQAHTTLHFTTINTVEAGTSQLWEIPFDSLLSQIDFDVELPFCPTLQTQDLDVVPGSWP